MRLIKSLLLQYWVYFKNQFDQWFRKETLGLHFKNVLTVFEKYLSEFCCGRKSFILSLSTTHNPNLSLLPHIQIFHKKKNSTYKIYKQKGNYKKLTTRYNINSPPPPSTLTPVYPFANTKNWRKEWLPHTPLLLPSASPTLWERGEVRGIWRWRNWEEGGGRPLSWL